MGQLNQPWLEVSKLQAPRPQFCFGTPKEIVNTAKKVVTLLEMMFDSFQTIFLVIFLNTAKKVFFFPFCVEYIFFNSGLKFTNCFIGKCWNQKLCFTQTNTFFIIVFFSLHDKDNYFDLQYISS